MILQGGAPGGQGGAGGLLAASEPSAALTALLLQDADDYTWIAAAVGSNSASGYQLATEEPVMAVGGFISALSSVIMFLSTRFSAFFISIVASVASRECPPSNSHENEMEAIANAADDLRFIFKLPISIREQQ